jgi:hypothetical protein
LSLADAKSLTTAEALLQLPTTAKPLLSLVLTGSESRNRRKGEPHAWTKGKTVEANSRKAPAMRGQNIYFTWAVRPSIADI